MLGSVISICFLNHALFVLPLLPATSGDVKLLVPSTFILTSVDALCRPCSASHHLADLGEGELPMPSFLLTLLGVSSRNFPLFLLETLLHFPWKMPTHLLLRVFMLAALLMAVLSMLYLSLPFVSLNIRTSAFIPRFHVSFPLPPGNVTKTAFLHKLLGNYLLYCVFIKFINHVNRPCCELIGRSSISEWVKNCQE